MAETATVDPLSLNKDASPSRQPSMDVTRRTLRQLYTTVVGLQDLVPESYRLVEEDDSEEYKSLVGELIVASTALVGPPELPETVQKASVTMEEIVDQVQQRIFAAHAKEYQRDKAAGRMAWATPKNVLAFGYRLVFPNTVAASLVTSPEWGILASRLGPDALIDLLASPTTAVFTALPNACLLQVSGTPVAELRLLSSDTAATTRAQSGRPAHQRRKRKRRRKACDVAQVDESADETAPGSPMSIDPTQPVPSLPPSPSQVPRIEVPASPSPTKRARILGPSHSAPDFGQPGGGSQRLFASTSPSKRSLVATQSVGSTFGASEMSERPAKRRRLETLHSANSVVLSRHRMYHNRLAKVKGGRVPYGLPAKQILTRLPSLFPPIPTDELDDKQSKAISQAPARHLAKYIFPRQFGMHNAFTSPKPRTSLEVLPDYLDRELEIKKLGSSKTPSRLKVVLPHLERLALLSRRCNFRKVLDKRCPSKVNRKSLSQDERSAVLELIGEMRTQVSRGELSVDISHTSLVIPHGQTQANEQARSKPKLAEFACSLHEVDRYVQEIVREVIPKAFWGSEQNFKLVQKQISSFLALRRYETTSLHALLQGFAVLDCDWLAPTSTASRHQRPTAADINKRRELLSEFLYWFFDSFVIDLVRTAFYVTDAATHQNRPLYFRQDDWNALCGPLLAQLGDSVFEKVPKDHLLNLQRERELGYSYVRLLPKETGVRPIVNLARRPLKIEANGQKTVGQPINKILQSVFDVLTFEKKRKPYLVGSLVSDPQQIYAKIRTYKSMLLAKHGGKLPKLYFVKVDVRAAYDTIQQDKLLQIVEAVLTETMYWVQKYSQVTPINGRPFKSFKREACTDGDLGTFEELASKLAQELHNVVLSDQVTYTSVARDRLMHLLREHITTNLVKVSGRLYRQKTGIPQGSIMSSLLCALFYGDMERRKLAFTDDENSTLLRYVDDFLFITTERARAVQFLSTMSDGIPEYGCAISPDKRLMNFDVALADGEVVPPLPEGEDFPWCGLAINPETLEVRVSTTAATEKDVVNQLTIQRHRKPGQAFLHAMFRAVKVRSHVMYTDTSHNSLSTVYINIYRSMLVVALKFQAYVQEWGTDPRRKTGFLYKIIQQVVNFQWADVVSKSRSRKAQALKVELGLKRLWFVWLGYHAFHRVLSRRPSVYSSLLTLLSRDVRGSAYTSARLHLAKVVAKGENGWADRGNAERKARRRV
ncbi:Telomerase reverse transcriptase [Rhodotorula toruloides]|nr:Telomerase reverse transcriptase [Rhodotorula toruloides]